MEGKYHFICGVAVGAVTLFMFHDKMDDSILEPILFGVGSVIGSLAPDIDMPTSAIGKPLKPISKLINRTFGHRTITHSGFWLILLWLLWLITKNSFILGYLLGNASHLFSDSLTSGGVAWLYPIDRKRIRLTRIKSGEGDMILTVISVLVFGLGNMAVRYLIDNPIAVSSFLSL